MQSVGSWEEWLQAGSEFGTAGVTGDSDNVGWPNCSERTQEKARPGSKRYDKTCCLPVAVGQSYRQHKCLPGVKVLMG